MESGIKRLVCSLRSGFMVTIELPVDFNKRDAERLKTLIDFEAELPTVRRKRGPNKIAKTHSVIDEITGNNKPKN